MQRFVRALLLAAIAAIVPCSVTAEPTRVHTVQQILRDGESVGSALGVRVTPLTGSPETSIRCGETIADGTRIDVPAHIVVIVESTGGKSTTTLEPGSSVTFVSTGQGEQVTSNGGKLLFSILPQSLDFFRVQSGEALTASVHGTVFSIDETNGSVTFTCTHGEVNIKKTGYLQIGEVREKVSLIDVISAAQTPRMTYQPTQTWYLATFATFAQAEAFYQQQLSTAQQSGNADVMTAALSNLGIVQKNQGHYADALASHQQALAFYGQLGDSDGKARALTNIGNVEEDQGRYDDALQSHRQALALFQQLGDRDGEAIAFVNIGNVQRDQGQYVDSLQSQQEALALFRQLDDRDGEARALGNIGVVQKSQGDYTDALQSQQQALAVLDQLGDRDGEARTLNNIGNVQHDQGHDDDALQSHQQALALLQQLGDRDGEARTLVAVGLVAEHQRRYTDALVWYQQAVSIFQQFGNQAAVNVVSGGIKRVQRLMNSTGAAP